MKMGVPAVNVSARMRGYALSGRTVDTAGTRTLQDRWLRRLAGYCWRYRRTALIALAGSLAATVPTPAIPPGPRPILHHRILDPPAANLPPGRLLPVPA